MSVDPGPIESTKPKKQPAPSKPTVKLGDRVVYTPTGVRASAMRSMRGAMPSEFLADVTFVDEKTVHLWVVPSHDLHPFKVMDATPGEGPNTFRPL